jgi:hypothetical protein
VCRVLRFFRARRCTDFVFQRFRYRFPGFLVLSATSAFIPPAL